MSYITFRHFTLELSPLCNLPKIIQQLEVSFVCIQKVRTLVPLVHHILPMIVPAFGHRSTVVIGQRGKPSMEICSCFWYHSYWIQRKGLSSFNMLGNCPDVTTVTIIIATFAAMTLQRAKVRKRMKKTKVITPTLMDPQETPFLTESFLFHLMYILMYLAACYQSRLDNTVGVWGA